MDSSVSLKDHTWFLRMCNHVSNVLYLACMTRNVMAGCLYVTVFRCVRLRLGLQFNCRTDGAKVMEICTVFMCAGRLISLLAGQWSGYSDGHNVAWPLCVQSEASVQVVSLSGVRAARFAALLWTSLFTAVREVSGSIPVVIIGTFR